MAKKTEQPKVNRLKTALGKRVNVTPADKGLGRDVKTPKWLRAIGAYFKGAAHELGQVKWPTRRAT